MSAPDFKIDRDDIVEITIRARVFDFVTDHTDNHAGRLTVLVTGGVKYWLVAESDEVAIAKTGAEPREDYVPVVERPCQFGCIDGWASAQCPVHGVKAFLAGVLASPPPPAAAVSDERIQEILNHLNGFVACCEIPHLDAAVAWALKQPEVTSTGGPDDNGAEVELVDGTAFEFGAAKRWFVATKEADQ